MRAVVLLFILLISPQLRAACSTPGGTEGHLNWDTGSASFKWCNGNVWVSSLVSPGLSCAGNPTGMIAFDSGDLRFCDGTFWQSMKGVSINSCPATEIGKFTFDASRKLWKYCDGLFWNAMYTAAAPDVSAIAANDNNNLTNRNAISMDLVASVSDGGSMITHVCLKHSTSGSPPTSPTADDSCWIPVTLMGGVPGASISLANFFYNVGFTPANYTIFSWVKTGANLISALSSSGNGTASEDYDAITFSPGFPPTLINVFATNSDSPTLPPLASDLSLTPGASVYIKWKLTDDEALPGTPVELSYTTDEVTYTTIASGLVNGNNGGCTVTPGTHTGCYVWTSGAPASTYFKVRVKGTDAAALSTITGAEPNNMSPFKVIAGVQDPGVGSSAASAVMFPYNKSHQTESGAGTFIVRDNGTFYVNDDRGLMMIDPNDGNYKLFLPVTGTATDGALSTATLRSRPLKMALDYSDRLLILDWDRIRRVDFTSNTITTIVGGGGSTADGTDALSFNLDAPWERPPGLLFTVLPNGNIWFQSRPDHYAASRSAGVKLRYYQASDNKVYSLTPTGTGSLENPAFDPSSYQVFNIGIEFNPITSAVTRIRSRTSVPYPGGHTPYSTSYDPVTGVATAPHVPFVSYWADDNTINSRSGEMYSVERFVNPGLHKYNPGTNTWTRIIGNGTRGSCVDGTLATACATDMTDAFITSQNQIFVIDRGLIRTVDANGNMLTVFGQSLSYGDGGLAVNARLNEVHHIDLSWNDKIVLADASESVLREFLPDGNIVKIAGNGVDGGGDTTSPATTQPVTTSYWGGSYHLTADSTDGTIYFTRGGSYLSKIDRTTGMWVDIAGHGGTSYTTGQGLNGNQIQFDGYNDGALGFNGTDVLRHTQRWNGTLHPDGMITSHNKDTGVQTNLVGVLGVEVGSTIDACPDGDGLLSCRIPSNFHSAISKAQWVSGQWLLHQQGSNKIRTATPGGNWGTLVSLPRGAQSYRYVMKGSEPHVYYCSAGRMYKYNLSTSVETTLPWPTASISCYGFSLVWHPTRQTIVFPIKQNGIGGVAEIYDPNPPGGGGGTWSVGVDTPGSCDPNMSYCPVICSEPGTSSANPGDPCSVQGETCSYSLREGADLLVRTYTCI